MAFNPTDEQRLAINKKGNILVCAAAGSGKTAVLVERVITMLTDKKNPVSANRLLIVTFTNAAASEMRSRIEKRLYEESAKNPFDLALKKQKYLISSAKICTIDSFCIDLVRENFHKLGVSPDFKISTGEKLTALNNKIVNFVLLKQMENPTPEFYNLLELVGCEYDEKNLAECIKNIFDYSMITPFPDDFLDSLYSGYATNFSKDNVFYKQALMLAEQGIKNISNIILSALETADRLLEEGIRFRDYFLVYRDITEKIENVVNSGEWDTIKDELDGFVMPPIPRAPKLKDVIEISLLRQSREAVLEEINSLKTIFSKYGEEIDKKNRQLYPAVKLLIDLVKEYKEELFKAQLEENSLTFYNTEQLALKFLCHRDENGNIVENLDAKEYFDQFDEVLVDEYQDVNDLQDTLFYILSDRERKLFAVGDVKQSIYGFRGANPNNFLNKKNRYIPVSEAKDENSKKIILANNFRSRKEVCEYINFFFENIMTKENGQIVYDREERLVATAEFADTNEVSNRICLVDELSGVSEDRLTIEARAIAMQIGRVMESGECIHQGKTLRRAKYSDFAILLRSTTNVAEKITSELEKLGIPADYSSESFIELLEVDTLLSLLKIIDNPADDIALLTVLMSPIFRFSAEELAQFRAEHKSGDLISVLAFFRDKNKKVNEFYDALGYYRSNAAVLPLGSFVFKLIELTGYGDIVSAMSDGIRRHANLLKLAEYAKDYQENYGGSLSGFVEYMRKTAGEKQSSAKVSSGADSVKVMSIHASKGLQFPVCIIANIDAKMNMRDSTDAVLFNEKTGLGFKYYDEQEKQKTDTISRVLISRQMRFKTLEEELRLMYVALTRAEDMLIIIGAYNNLEKKLTDLSSLILSEGGDIKNRSYKVSSVGDWILMTALMHPNGEKLRKFSGIPLSVKDTASNIDVEIIRAQDIPEYTVSVEKEDAVSVNKELCKQIVRNISYKYPFDALRNVEAKCSASALSGKAEGDKYNFNSRPSFMESEGITGADKGTAIHKVMQFINFDADSVADEVERLSEYQFISDTEAESVDIKAIERFFESDIFARIKKSSDCRREMRFLTEIPAGDVDSSLEEHLRSEKVIVQGAVDLCFIEDDGIVILDFKSDRVDSPETLKSAYKEQLNIYEKAVSKIFEKPVKEKVIYSFALSEEIKL